MNLMKKLVNSSLILIVVILFGAMLSPKQDVNPNWDYEISYFDSSSDEWYLEYVSAAGNKTYRAKYLVDGENYPRFFTVEVFGDHSEDFERTISKAPDPDFYKQFSSMDQMDEDC